MDYRPARRFGPVDNRSGHGLDAVSDGAPDLVSPVDSRTTDRLDATENLLAPVLL
jgi:hypothetical protein